MSPAEPVRLRTGALTAVFADGALRDVRVGGYRALDAVYAAVRDPGWGTVPGRVADLRAAVGADAFTVGFTSHHGDAFRWHGRIEGHHGTLTFDFDGDVHAPLAANRIGLCLLHPIDLAGATVTAVTVDGERPGRFPDRISPHQPFVGLVGLSYDAGPGARLDIALAGDLFEMEDHRNWTDAGFKTYCTPLREPHPVTHRPGDRIQQRVRLTARATGVAAPARDVVVDPEPVGRLPRIGWSASAPSTAQMARLRTARPAHIHARVRLGSGQAGSAIEAAAAEARALGARLDLAVLAPADPQVDGLVPLLAPVRDRIGRVSVFDADSLVTRPGMATTMRQALRRLGVDAPVGGGSAGYFTELNRTPPPADELDFGTYGICPQVHHDDGELVMDTLLAQPHTVRDARVLTGGLPVVVAPVSLHPPGAGPDPRQRGDFLAAWTVGSVAALAGAAAITYFEGTGACGLLTDPDQPFPVFRILAGLAGHTGEPVRTAGVPARHLAVLAVGRLLLVANLSPAPRRELVVDGGTRHTIDLPPYGATTLER